MSRMSRMSYVIVCLGLMALFVLPVLFLVWQSLAPADGNSLIQAENSYQAIFEILPFWRYLGNSLFIVVIAVPLTCLVSSLVGFAMAQLPPRPRRQLLGLSGVWLIIPASAVWLFRFQLFDWAGLIDSRLVLLLPAVAGSSPLFVLLHYWTVRSLPAGLVEAARLDGASPMQIWILIISPLT